MGGIADTISNVGGTLFGKSPKPGKSGYTNLPEDIRADYRSMLDQVQDVAGTTEPFAPSPFSAEQLDILNKQVGGLRQGVDFQRPVFNFGQQANAAFGQAGDLYNRAGSFVDAASPYVQQSADYTSRGASPITGAEIQSSIGDFINPYTDQVVNQTMRDMEEYARGAFSDARGMIGDYGASGSNRESLLMGEIASQLAQDTARQTSALRQSGFESAANRALSRLQGDRSNALAGAGLSLNQAGTTLQQSGQLGSLGAGLANLGGSYLQGRGLMADIEQQNRANAYADLASRMAAGEVLRAQEQGQSQVPLQQLALLQSFYQPLLAGSTGERAGDSGLVGRIAGPLSTFFGGGDKSASAGAKSFIGM